MATDAVWRTEWPTAAFHVFPDCRKPRKKGTFSASLKGLDSPTHYFKAALAVATDNSKTIWAFILPNDKIATKTPIKRFAVPTDYLEHWAGLDLWSELDDTEETDLEKTTAEPWVETLPTKE